MGRKQRKAKKRNDPLDRFLRPTPEREAANDFRSAGPAVRVIPVIEQLHSKGVLTAEEYKALAYYRDQASLADKSPVRSCCDFSPRGGHGPGVAILSAKIETGRIERNMGALWELCRAVCVDDVTLEAWCLAKYGSQHIEGEPSANPEMIGIATLELKYAAGGIVQ